MSKENPFSDWSPEMKRIARESLTNAFGKKGSEKRDAVAKEISGNIGRLLRQEYKIHNGSWWLWSLGKPTRPLTTEENFNVE